MLQRQLYPQQRLLIFFIRSQLIGSRVVNLVQAVTQRSDDLKIPRSVTASFLVLK